MRRGKLSLFSYGYRRRRKKRKKNNRPKMSPRDKDDGGQQRRPRPLRRQTSFAVNYGRTGFPLVANYDAVNGQRFRWLVPFESVDYRVYVPLLTDGLRDRPRPYGACAAHGLWDMLAREETGGCRVLSAVPYAVRPLRRALDVGPRDWTVVVRALKTLQKFAIAGGHDYPVGRALVPYYRHLLLPFRVYLCNAGHVTATDGLNVNVTYNVADLCTDTLITLEHTGGRYAYRAIKCIVPTYENLPVCQRADGRVNIVFA